VSSTDSVNSLPSEAPSNEGASDRHACGCSNCGCGSSTYLSKDDDNWVQRGYRKAKQYKKFSNLVFTSVLEAMEQKAKAKLEKAEAKKYVRKQSKK